MSMHSDTVLETTAYPRCTCQVAAAPVNRIPANRKGVRNSPQRVNSLEHGVTLNMAVYASGAADHGRIREEQQAWRRAVEMNIPRTKKQECDSLIGTTSRGLLIQKHNSLKWYEFGTRQPSSHRPDLLRMVHPCTAHASYLCIWLPSTTLASPRRLGRAVFVPG